MDYYTNVAPQIRGQKTQAAATNLLQNDITPDMLSDAQVTEMGVSRVELENEYASQQKANEAIRVAEERAAAAEGRTQEEFEFNLERSNAELDEFVRQSEASGRSREE